MDCESYAACGSNSISSLQELDYQLEYIPCTERDCGFKLALGHTPDNQTQLFYQHVHECLFVRWTDECLSVGANE